MDSRAGRRVVLLLIAAPIGLAVASTLLIMRGRQGEFPSGRTAAGASVAHVDLPLGAIACEDLPVKTPDPDEAARDEQTRPYHLLVRALDFPSLAPVDVDAEQLVVRGAQAPRRVAVGEYLFEGIQVGYTSVSLMAPQDPAAPRRPGVEGRQARLAERNPVPLARCALTTCDLVVFGPEDLAWTVALHGTVEEPASKRPIAGARVACGAQATLSDDQGRFEFTSPVSWNDLANGTSVTCAGYDAATLRVPALSAAWIRAVVEKHEAIFWMQPSDRVAARALVPALPR